MTRGVLLFDSAQRTTGLILVAIFAVVVVGITAAGLGYDRHVQRQLRARAEHELGAVADLEVRLVQAWRDERELDAVFVAGLPSIAAAAAGDRQPAGFAPAVLAAAARSYGWANAMVVRGAEVRLALGWAPLLGPEQRTLVSLAAAGGRASFSELSADAATGEPRVDLVTPIRGVSGAALMVRLDPRQSLFPAVEGNASSRRTAETVLVRRDGEAALILAGVRNARAAPLAVRLPLAERGRTAVQAALGAEGVLRGVDHRGVPVAAVARHIPGSTWTVISQVDRAELSAASHLGRAAVVMAVGGLLCFAAAAVALVWRSQAAHREAAIRESEERLKLVLEGTDAAVWDADLVTGRTWLNDGWARLLGRPTDRFTTFEEATRLVHPEDAPGAEQALQAHLAGKTPLYDRELRFRHASGAWIWAHTRAKVVSRDPSGRPLRLAGTCIDVTARRRLQEQLLLSERMASVGTLAAGVAHELNNPLAYVMANLTYAGETVRDLLAPQGPGAAAGALRRVGPELVEALDEAADGAGRLRAIVSDLRSFSRAPGRARGRADLAEVVRSAVNMARHELKHRARLALDLAAVPAVAGDEGRLGQVVLNLLVNAAQAVEEGHTDQHEVRVTLGLAPDGRVALEVRDDGCGIPPEALTRVFDPFFTTKRAGEGTGLGLAICRGIVEEAGGEIRVASQVGKGSTFTVLLRPAPPAAAAPSPAAPPAVRRARVLVVDDDLLVAKAVERILARRHQVTLVSSGRAALERLAAERYDVVVSDVLMPEMTGLELQAALRAGAPELAARMVFMTGGAFTARVREELRENRNPRLDKPFTPEQLLEAVERALG